MNRTQKTPHHVYWMTTQSDEVGVVSGYAHLITSGDLSINQLVSIHDNRLNIVADSQP